MDVDGLFYQFISLLTECLSCENHGKSVVILLNPIILIHFRHILMSEKSQISPQGFPQQFPPTVPPQRVPHGCARHGVAERLRGSTGAGRGVAHGAAAGAESGLAQ
jgi:hypothetical protein